jgi:Domain of unknown function (DUF6046)
VKELVAAEDYKISVKGIVLNTDNPNEYPEREVAALRRLFEKNTALSIENTMCRLMGISIVVVDTLTLNEDVGYPGLQSYVLSLVSDTAFEFEIVK